MLVCTSVTGVMDANVDMTPERLAVTGESRPVTDHHAPPGSSAPAWGPCGDQEESAGRAGPPGGPQEGSRCPRDNVHEVAMELEGGPSDFPVSSYPELGDVHTRRNAAGTRHFLERPGRPPSIAGSFVDGTDSDDGFREEEGDSDTVNLAVSTLTRNLRHRGNRRPVLGRLRQKRQTLQDMARPLKHWLYKHRANPYPTKDEKAQLARSAHMTLTQVSNWFANARRRLKNTVQDPGLSWGRRIKLYNSCVEGNAERLSVCSDDDLWDTDMESSTRESSQTRNGDSRLDHIKLQTQELPTTHSSNNQLSGHRTILRTEHAQNEYDACANSDDGSGDEQGTQPRKYKHSILHRYLNDSYDRVLQPHDAHDRQRYTSGSLSSHDYEEWSSSSCSSPSYNVFEDQMDDIEQIARQWQANGPSDSEDMYFKEISAALALITLARSRFRRVPCLKT